jgi:oxaloacetate decarboxylase gamma subunit
MEPSITELLLAGVKLMLIGMGIVYLFLALLVWIIGVTSNLVHRYTSDSDSGLAADFPVSTESGAESDDAEMVAAISAAIHRYENP